MGVVLAVGGVTGLPDEPLGELDEGMVGVFSTLMPLSFIVMAGKLYSREMGFGREVDDEAVGRRGFGWWEVVVGRSPH